MFVVLAKKTPVNIKHEVEFPVPGRASVSGLWIRVVKMISLVIQKLSGLPFSTLLCTGWSVMYLL